MKFTILPDFEANKKRRAVRRQKRAERRDARQSRKNHWYLKRKKFWQVWLERFVLVFLILGMGGAWYFRTVVQDTEDNAEFEMDQSQEIIQTYIERWYDELTAMGMRPGKELDDQMGAYMYRMIPSRLMGAYGVSAAAAAIYNENGELIIDSNPRFYLYCDRYEPVGDEKDHTINLYQSYYTCAQELSDEFLQDYNDYFIYGDIENGERMEFGDLYVDEEKQQFYFSTVSCLEHGKVVKTYDFKPEHVEGMETVQETYDSWTREGTRWYPVLGMRSAEITELLQFAYDVYDDYKDDKQLKGAGVTAERGYFAKTYAQYNVIEVSNLNNSNPEYTVVFAYNYDFLQANRGFVQKFVICLILAILLISFLWARFTYVRLKARYELEDYQRSLTNAMAHDLKSPLMILSGMAENLKENVHTEKREYYAEEMLKNIADMNRMIEQSLGFSKLSQTGRVGRKTEVDMRAQTDALIGKYKELAEAQGQHISVTGEGQMRGNEAMLRQMVDNLLQNAILHGVKGVTAGQIIVSAIEYENDFVISVFNNGNSADKKKIEDLLKGEKNQRAVTGIGLYNVNSRLKLLYGESYGLIYNEKVRNGFEIWVRLPKKITESEER